MPGVKWVVGNQWKDDIVSIIETHDSAVRHSFSVAPRPLSTENTAGGPGSLYGRTRFTIKIQEGCNSRCAYCIVPFLRGPSRSAALSQIAVSVEEASLSGFREVVLTGTHIGQYKDPETGDGIEKLIERIISIKPNDFRIRLSSLNPGDVTAGLCDLIASNERICDHMHISAQCLCPEVLNKMGRSEKDLSRCFDLCARVRLSRPFLSTGMDLLTGFPGETDDMFRMSVDEVGRWGISYAHIFRFSRRPGTAADTMPKQIIDREKTQRAEMLRLAVAQCRKQFIHKQIGTSHIILVEESKPVSGLSSNYLRIECPEAAASGNSWLRVRLDGYDPLLNKCTGSAAL
jgi:threonylcarbamoyladenosine tRNA methylthiotransferase MtaB